MVNKPLKVTDYELAVLEVLWQRGSASIRQVPGALLLVGRRATCWS